MHSQSEIKFELNNLCDSGANNNTTKKRWEGGAVEKLSIVCGFTGHVAQNLPGRPCCHG